MSPLECHGPGNAARSVLVIVDLAVVREHMRAQHHRLVAARRQIQDRQPAVTENDARLAPHAFTVRSAMPQTLRHGVDRVNAGSRTDDPGDSAHGRQSIATLWAMYR